MNIFTVSFGRCSHTLILSGKDVHGPADYPIQLPLTNDIVDVEPFENSEEINSDIMVSDAPASAAYFASYELIQRWLQGPDR